MMNHHNGNILPEHFHDQILYFSNIMTRVYSKFDADTLGEINN